jgi:hypothetical protein
LFHQNKQVKIFSALSFDFQQFHQQQQCLNLNHPTRELTRMSQFFFPFSETLFDNIEVFALNCRKSVKKDFSTAILERKKSPNRLVVDEALNDDNSVVVMHPQTMEKLGIFRGDTILIKVKF